MASRSFAEFECVTDLVEGLLFDRFSILKAFFIYDFLNKIPSFHNLFKLNICEITVFSAIVDQYKNRQLESKC